MNISREAMSFEMCPIRHFKKNVVQLMESYANFVFAVDTEGELAVFLINEDDLENDDDTLQV